MINAAINVTNRDNGFSLTLWGRNINDEEFIQGAFNVPGSDAQGLILHQARFMALQLLKNFKLALKQI